MTLQIVQDEAADEVLSTNAFALLCAMLLMEQVSIKVAFAGPAIILDRFGSLDPTAIADAPAEEFAQLCATEPAIHPYPESMSVLIQAVASYIVVNHDGDTASLWETAGSGQQLLSRLMLLPGFSKRRAQIFVALLGKQLDVRPAGWEQSAGVFAEPDSFRSVADVRDPESLEKVQNAKLARQNSQGEAGDGPPTDGESSHHTESQDSANVTTEEEQAADGESVEGVEDAPAVTAKRAARQAKKRAARQANKRAARKGRRATHAAEEGTAEPATHAEPDPVADGEDAESADPEALAAKRAGRRAKKSAKRAAKRAARADSSDAPATKRPGKGRKKAAARRRARKEAAAGGDQPATSDDGAATESAPDAPTADGDDS